MRNKLKSLIAIAVVTGFLLVMAVACGGGGSAPTGGDANLLSGTDSPTGDLAAESSASDSGGVRPGPGVDGKPQPKPDVAPTERPLEREHRFHPLFGEITELTDGTITIAPYMPEGLAEMLERRHAGRETDRPDGFEHPDRPETLTFALLDYTEYYIGELNPDANPFGVGDKVAIIAGRDEAVDMRVAKVVMDSEIMLRKMQERFEAAKEGEGHEGWQKHEGCDGECDGEFERDAEKLRHRGRPVFGVVTGLTDALITVEPQLPDFIRERLAEHPDHPMPELPESMSFKLTDDTIYKLDGEQVRPGAFAVGDEVLVFGYRDREAGEDALPLAKVIMDMPTPEEMRLWMEKMHGGEHAEHGKYEKPPLHDGLKPRHI